MINKFFYSFLYKIPNGFFPNIISFYLSFKSPKRSNNYKQILYINTHDQSGGASKIAFQLAKSQLQKLKVYFLVKIKKRTEEWIYVLQSKNETFTSAFSNYLNDQEKKGEWLDFSEISFVTCLDQDFIKDSSLIHLHNLHGGYFSYALLPLISKNKHLIWTLHDEHIMTGHCSFTMKCLGWENKCSTCQYLNIYPAINKDNAKLILEHKKKWLQKSRITYVTPSKWLHDRVIQAFPFLKNNIKVIPNGVDTNVFKPNSKEKARKAFNLPKNKFLILFIAEFSTNNPFKGGETFREIVSSQDNDSILFITVGGEHNVTQISKKIIELPYITDEKKLALLYSACDLMVYPTNADNHPLVVLEAMSSGLPVLAPEIGGIPEIIENDIDGWLVPKFSNSTIYREKINEIFDLLMGDEFSCLEISKNATNKISKSFNLNKMIFEYEKLYERVLNE